MPKAILQMQISADGYAGRAGSGPVSRFGYFSGIAILRYGHALMKTKVAI